MKKYVDILADIERKISGGQFESGQKLPSVRNAAKMYSCSVSTVTRAYTELESRHMIYSISQSGYYVVEKPGKGRDAVEGGQIDFASASPDPSLFPYLDFRHALNQALDTYQSHLFTCGEAEGLERLRHTLVSHFAEPGVCPSGEDHRHGGCEPSARNISKNAVPEWEVRHLGRTAQLRHLFTVS